jgi:tRNA threonylcarbamoyladenosine biosynthesis protein TsaB
MNILHIDASNNKEITVALEMDGKKDMLTKQSETWKAQIVLPLIQELLRKHNLTLKDIHAVQVNRGPGSFTGLRVGVAIANTLGAWLKIPINGKKVGEIVEPVYT